MNPFVICRVADNHESNRMTASNLAIVFGPTLLKRNESVATLNAVMETIHQARAVELLTLYIEEIFGPVETVTPRNYAKYAIPYNSYQTPPKLSLSMRGGTSSSGMSAASDGGDLVSSQTERRGELHGPDFTLPGHVSNPEDVYGASVSDDEDDDGDPTLPNFLLPDGSSKSKKSPLLCKSNSKPIINKINLGNFTGECIPSKFGSLHSAK